MIHERDRIIPDIQLNSHLCIPSTVHGYSLAIEYMTDWFLSKFNNNFFKTVYINGKHVFDDWRRENNKDKLKIEKPAVAIVPVVDYDFDRDTLDLYQGGANVYTRRSTIYDASFFRDFDKNLFLGIKMQALRMNFGFKVRVKSRAQQLDLFKMMEIYFRVGSTQGERISMDFHIPQEIMLNLAKDAGFEVYQKTSSKGDTLYAVRDIKGFLKYLNSHSLMPFMYKFRTINGNSEFFIRVKDLYVHIANLDKLQLDDGEQEGQLFNNFHIEMASVLTIPIPHFYTYYTNNRIRKEYGRRDDYSGLYTFKQIEPPNKNEKGWDQYLSTEWVSDDKYIDKIEFEELLENKEMKLVIDFTKDTFISPAIFLDIKMYNSFKELDIKIDWENFIIYVNQKVNDLTSQITIYADLEYMNQQLENIFELDKSRLS